MRVTVCWDLPVKRYIFLTDFYMVGAVLHGLQHATSPQYCLLALRQCSSTVQIQCSGLLALLIEPYFPSLTC